MRHRRASRTPGFSLLEILVAIGIFALFTMTLTRIMLGGMQTFKRGQAISGIRSDLRSAMDLISADFRQARPAVTIPSFASGKVNSWTLTFDRYADAGTGNTEPTITYQITSANRLTRTDLDTGQVVLVADNILTGPRLGESPGVALSPSYFKWAIIPTSSYDGPQGYQFGTLEVKLMGLRFEGQQEQRMSMVTRIAQRTLQAGDLGTNTNADMQPKILLAAPADLGRPNLLPSGSTP